jgi:prophage DNA circulation protein
LADVELYHPFYGHRESVVQRFESLAEYQAESWPHPRRMVAKIEVTPVGSQRRFVVTNLEEEASAV